MINLGVATQWYHPKGDLVAKPMVSYPMMSVRQLFPKWTVTMWHVSVTAMFGIPLGRIPSPSSGELFFTNNLRVPKGYPRTGV
jgi:hypothetical protein